MSSSTWAFRVVGSMTHWQSAAADIFTGREPATASRSAVRVKLRLSISVMCL